MPAPSTMHFYRFTQWGEPACTRRARVLRRPRQGLPGGDRRPARAGCRYVQLDEVALAMLCDPAAQAKVRPRAATGRAGGSLRRRDQRGSERPAGRHGGRRAHVPRQLQGHVPLRRRLHSVAERFFARAQVNHFLLEFDTPRAGDFAPLRFVPKRRAWCSAWSARRRRSSSLDVLKSRADRGGEARRSARLAISPQCGFASTMGGNPVTEADERAKLRLCVEAARASGVSRAFQPLSPLSTPRSSEHGEPRAASGWDRD